MKTTEELLEELFDKGEVTYEFNIGEKYPIKIKNITAQDFIDMDDMLKENKMTKIGFSQLYIMERISRVVVSINNKTFADPMACKDYLSSMPSKFSDKILEEHKALENALKTALSMEEIEDNFFAKGASQTS